MAKRETSNINNNSYFYPNRKKNRNKNSSSSNRSKIIINNFNQNRYLKNNSDYLKKLILFHLNSYFVYVSNCIYFLISLLNKIYLKIFDYRNNRTILSTFYIFIVTLFSTNKNNNNRNNEKNQQSSSSSSLLLINRNNLVKLSKYDDNNNDVETSNGYCTKIISNLKNRTIIKTINKIANTIINQPTSKINNKLYDDDNNMNDNYCEILMANKQEKRVTKAMIYDDDNEKIKFVESKLYKFDSINNKIKTIKPCCKHNKQGKSSFFFKVIYIYVE